MVIKYCRIYIILDGAYSYVYKYNYFGLFTNRIFDHSVKIKLISSVGYQKYENDLFKMLFNCSIYFIRIIFHDS